MDERHSVRSRLSDPLGIGQGRLLARKRCLLRVGDIRHQAQIVAYGMADGLGSTELPQTLRAVRKDVRADERLVFCPPYTSKKIASR